MFEYFVGVLYGLALLSNHFVVLFCAHLSLYGDTFGLACVVDLCRRFLDASGDGIILAEGW